MTLKSKSSMTPDQARATDPQLTAWVGASAGTGKTHVLTARVLRLMVTGTPPENILCLTFTKAAAAEMKNRIFAELGRWTMLPDDMLAEEILARTNEFADEAMLNNARQLFANVLDLVNGFQIQTFHSFCQSLLGRFPLEAGLTPGFEGVDDTDATEIMAAAKDRMLAATREPLAKPLQDALDIVAGLVTETTFDEVVDRLVFEVSTLTKAMRAYGGVQGLLRAVYDRLGADPAKTDAAIIGEACASESLEVLAIGQLAAALAAGSAADKKRGEAMQVFLGAPEKDRPKLYPDYKSAFLTKSGTPLKTVATKKVLSLDEGLESVIADEQARLMEIEQTRVRQKAAAATAALLRLGLEQLTLYRHTKQERGLVDFDDMIDHTVTLFSQADAAPWILYKLDHQIDHILVDEAQDTNRDQWAVVETLAAEFFSGESAREIERTVFAVGDVKQSIFSFQRADPAEFLRAQRRIFGRAHEATRTAQTVPLNVSFRSGEAVLALVDQVFADDGRATAGLSFDGETIRHGFQRKGHGGCVELWPLEAPSALVSEETDGWQLPLHQETRDDAEQRAAWKIADHIARSIGSRNLPAKGRPVRAGDNLILVRRRSAFVDHLIRGLKSHGVPVSGRDRMSLVDELPVMDLLVLAQFALLPDDDLALATVLKGPFVGLDDDALFDLAHDRPGSLWDRLQSLKSEQRYSFACSFLWQVLGQVDQGGPFDFFSYVLVELGGRKKLAMRLGNEIDDPIDELLEEAIRFQLTKSASLLSFTQLMKRNQSQLKRDMEQAGDQVRIMTIHSAKGLQAPIVYLADTVSTPDLSKDGRLLPLAAKEGGSLLPVWASQGRGIPEVEDAREALKARQLEEYRRLLYVALTRAEDELYVAGWRGSAEPGADCWYRLIEEGFDRLSAKETASITGSRVRRYEVAQRVSTPSVKPLGGKAAEIPALPGWITEQKPSEPTPARPLSPSRPDEEPAVAGPMERKSNARYRRGNVLHQLLQWLPDLASENRKEAALAHLQRSSDVSDEEQLAFWNEAEAVLNYPSFARIFAPGSRAEVPIVGVLTSKDGAVSRTVSGQVDRLLVTDSEILIVDYKTNRPPPRSLEKVQDIYFRQMGLYMRVLSSIYPDHRVSCALLWTDGPFLMELPTNRLEAALQQMGL